MVEYVVINNSGEFSKLLRFENHLWEEILLTACGMSTRVRMKCAKKKIDFLSNTMHHNHLQYQATLNHKTTSLKVRFPTESHLVRIKSFEKVFWSRKKMLPPQSSTKLIILQWFHNFCRQTSMHGWQFIGDRQFGFRQALFWIFVILGSMGTLSLFSQEAISEYSASTVKVDIKDRSAPLDNAFFPSVMICNVNPLRKSFIYWLAENLKLEGDEVSVGELFRVIGNNFFKTSNKSISDEDTNLLERIFNSRLYQAGFEEFLAEKEAMNKALNGTSFSNSKVFLFSAVGDMSLSSPYSNSTRSHSNFFLSHILQLFLAIF